MNRKFNAVLAAFTLVIAFFSQTSWAKEAGKLVVDSVQEKQVEAKHFYFGEFSIEQAKDEPTSSGIAKKLAQVIAFETSTQINGAFSVVVEGFSAEKFKSKDAMLQMGWWVMREGEPVDNFRSELKPAAKSLSAQFKGHQDGLMQAWQDLYQMAVDKGYQVKGDGRTLINLHSNTGYLLAELQLIVE